MADALRLYGLKGLVALSAEGIGEAIARTFVKHGADVLAVDTPESGIDTVFGRTRGIMPLAAERVPEDIDSSTVQSRLGGLDILVNNFAGLVDAAAGEDEDTRQVRLERVLEHISTTSSAMLPLLKKSPAGRIINIGCLRSSFGRAGGDEFAASEDAIAKATAQLAADLGKFGITANYLQPGAIMTPASRAIFTADKDFRDWCIASSAARRLGEPIDVAKVALFLATDDSVFVSGTGIPVDGGQASGSPRR